MTTVSNDPIWWPVINANIIAGYFVVAAFIGLTYDWALTFGKEVELVWRQRWSLMTILYLSVRYLGILYSIMNMLFIIPTISVTDAGCQILYFALNWTNTVAFPILCAIMIARLYAMYQRSRRILILLVIIVLAINIFYGVATVMSTRQLSGEELILSGTYACSIDLGEEHLIMDVVTWILGTVWEVLVMCLAVWIAVKHFRELRQHSAGGIIGDCVKVLIKTHVVYFRTNFPWELSFFLAFFNFSHSCKCLYWDHASSLAFENIMPSLWPTPTQQPAWLQSLSRSTCIYRLTVVCDTGDVGWSQQVSGALQGAGEFGFFLITNFVVVLIWCCEVGFET